MALGEKTFLERKDTEVSFKISEDGVRLYKKRRLLDVGKKPKTIWFDSKYDASSSGIMFLRNFFLRIITSFHTLNQFIPLKMQYIFHHQKMVLF